MQSEHCSPATEEHHVCVRSCFLSVTWLLLGLLQQLADAVSALEQEKETAELCRFEESRRRGELQDK